MTHLLGKLERRSFLLLSLRWDLAAHMKLMLRSALRAGSFPGQAPAVEE